MPKYIQFCGLLLLANLFFSCDGLFQFNPNQIALNAEEKNLNRKNMERIKQLTPADTMRFILMGDTQRFYDESVDFVESANKQKNIAFVLHAGDISDFGLSQEFKWVNQIMQKLNYPYLTIIGNHDLIANGPIVYKKMYGELNYTFEYGNNKFIFIDTNSREYAFSGEVPNLKWLKSELDNNTLNKNAIVIGHVAPFHGDFDVAMEKEYAHMLASDKNVKFSLYGHQHSFGDSVYYDDGVRYFVTTTVGARAYMIITTWNGGYKAERIAY